MSGAALALVLGAAVVHAGWNALAKRARDPLVFLWSSISIASAGLLPLGFWVLRREGWSPDGAPFVVATILVHAIYFYALGRAYGSGEFSLVYPVARGLGVALVPILAFLALDERLSPVGSLGVALVIGGIVVLSTVSTARARRVRAASGLWWAMLTGATIGTYSVVDKAGVARVHPLLYISLLGVGMSLLLAPFVLRRSAALALEWRQNWRTIALASTMNLTSYLLVLFALRLSKAGYVVAARETSIVFSVLIGSLWMKEGGMARRLAGAAVVLLGVACVAMAR
jgi:drug/metabolite transporter (DMT)-like permease